MFDFVGKFFKGRQASKLEEARVSRSAALSERAAKTKKKGVMYDHGLIDNLEKDHELLVEIFGKIWSDGYEVNNFVGLSLHLREFKSMFQAHLLKENVKFYAYLEQSMKHDEHSLNVVREFRRDMNDIANAVIGFCKKYDSPLQTRKEAESFVKEYQGIGQALVRRVQLEERDLYSLYAPN